METQAGAPAIVQPVGEDARPSASGKTLPESMHQLVKDQDSEMDSETEEDDADWQTDPELQNEWQQTVSGLLNTACAQTFTGAFAYQAPLRDMPLPGLALADMGSFGLPLSERDAALIASRTTAAMPNVYVINSSQIILANPAFRTYMNSVRMQACAGLGVDPSSCIMLLQNLILCTASASLSPRMSTRVLANHFATVNVVLPSEFTGGNFVARQ